MSDSFTVDPRALGEIPATIDRARSALAPVLTRDAAAAAARGVPFGFGDGVARLGRALDTFAVAGVRALGDDAAAIARTAAEYARCEAEVAAGCDAIHRRLGHDR